MSAMESFLNIFRSYEVMLRNTVQGKVCVITGSSDGIGARLAQRMGAAGARVVLVARTPERLREVGDSIREAGGEAHEYVANLAEEEACDQAVKAILRDLGHVDIFVSNAGRSIRRSAKYQGDERFHDFKRLMALNFYGGLKMALGFLPSMMERKSGHIVHVSSFGVPTRQPRFAGYVASKSALDGALSSIAGEVAAHGIRTSSVFMPLVQTKMVVSKGFSYDHVTMLTLDMACTYIEHAVITKVPEFMDGPSRFLALLHFFRPDMIVGLNSLVYRLEAEQAPTDVCKEEKPVAKAKPRRTSTKQRMILVFLSNMLWFFSRLEFVLSIRGGMPWAVRDLIVTAIFLLVIAATPVCKLVASACSLTASGVEAVRSRARSRRESCQAQDSQEEPSRETDQRVSPSTPEPANSMTTLEEAEKLEKKTTSTQARFRNLRKMISVF